MNILLTKNFIDNKAESQEIAFEVFLTGLVVLKKILKDVGRKVIIFSIDKSLLKGFLQENEKNR